MILLTCTCGNEARVLPNEINRKLFVTRNFYYLVQWNLGMTKAKGKLFALTKFPCIELVFHILYYY